MRKNGLTSMIVGVSGAMVGLASGIFSLTESMLLIIAINETTRTIFEYIEK